MMTSIQNNRSVFFIFCAVSAAIPFSTNAAAQEAVTTLNDENQFVFDPSMLLGNSAQDKIASLHDVDTGAKPGKYQLDIYLNGTFISNENVELKLGDDRIFSPCLERSFLINVGVMAEKVNAAVKCALSKQIEGASADFNLQQLRLDIYIPQSVINRVPRGFVSPEKLSVGSSMFFLNYDSNYYRSDYKNGGGISDSGYLSAKSGLNLGLWQLRQNSNVMLTGDGKKHDVDFDAQDTYVQRPILPLKSEMKLGDNYTAGDQFNSMSFLGMKLSTDDRMLPDSLRGYAPVIHGIANSNAKVLVKQAGNVIYQTSVPPGSFTIDDLYPTSYQGDLQVDVQEADGSIRSFIVPFNAVPASVREKQYKYDFSIGKVRDDNKDNAPLLDAIFRYGISNAVTLNTGARLSDRYSSIALGGVYSNSTGAYALNAVSSMADIPGQGKVSGWKFGATYSHDITATNTNFSLAAFRYSTANYYDLSDVLGLRQAAETEDGTWTSTTYQQRTQLTATINQSLGKYGNLYFSGSSSDYRGNRGRDMQYQLGYNIQVKNVSYSLSLARQQTGASNYGVQENGSNASTSASMENTISFSFSMPLGSRTNVATTYTRQSGDSSSSSLQSSMNGTLGTLNDFSYALNASVDSQDASDRQATVGGAFQQQFSAMTIGGSLSGSKDYTQTGASARGAFVVHPGGVTFGPYVGDTFALVDAQGAEGASVLNGMGAKIDSHGYAIVPNLIPYKYNEILLDTSHMKNNNVDVVSEHNQRAPYFGSTLKVKVQTNVGYPLLISYDASSFPLKFGSDVMDENKKVVGIVSQGGLIFARVGEQTGALRIESGSETCLLPYDISKMEANLPLYRLLGQCQRINQ
jgi:outer membrane usher protein